MRLRLATAIDHIVTKEHRKMKATPFRRAGARSCRTLVATVLTLVVSGLSAASATAVPFDVTGFDVTQSATQAGAHADVVLNFGFQPPSHPLFPAFPDAAKGLSTLHVELPEGMIGDAGRFERCAAVDFNESGTPCPAASQVGEIRYDFVTPFGMPGSQLLPIYNLVPGPNEPAKLGFSISGIPVIMEIAVRNGRDYGLSTTVRSIPISVAITGMEVTLWGNPSAHVAGAPAVPFMTNPSDCSRPLTASMRARSYGDPDTWFERTDSLPAPTGCDAVPFSPGFSVRAENPIVDQPSAVQVGISIPEDTDPDGIASSALKQAIVRMPAGMTINPSLAHDRVSCNDSAFGLHNGNAVSCPPGSKIGTIGVDVPALRGPLPGDIYLGDPQDGNPFRLFLYAEGQGVRLKLLGSILPDPKTGRITAVFENTPQVAFRAFSLRFLGGERAALLMPRTCGTGQAEALLTPYSSSSGVGAADPVRTVGDAQGGPCPETAPFEPSFTAGVTNAGSGEDTGFTVAFGRPDGHQLLSKLKLELPAGLLGRLAAFPLCPNDQANAGTCSEDSMVGGVTVSAGSGSAPLNVPGRVFLTEPPNPGQIAGLAIVVPAIAGPYNLGTPIVRAGIKVNPDTSLTVDSDPLPTILSGVELRIKQVIVNMDRPGFMFNPTDCSPKVIRGSLTSTEGVEVGVASPFQVRGCSTKPLEGKLGMTLTAPDRDGGVSGLTFNLGGLPGHSNVRQIQAVLPSGVGARLDGPLQTPCKEADYAADTCAPSARIGTAKAVTPVLPEPLAGDVFFIENPGGNRLPRIGMKLKGAIQLDVVGSVEITPGGRVVATFSGIPDVPISDFQLQLDSGSQGVLASSGICGKTNYADVDVIGHTGKQVKERLPVTVTGCSAKSTSAKKAKKGKSKKKGGRGKR